MVLHMCPRCGYKTIYKTSLKEHYNKKKVCEPIIDDISIEDCLFNLNKKKEHLCDHCNKKFSRSDSLKRHKEKCYELRLKLLDKKNKELDEKNNELDEKNKELEKQIKVSEPQESIITDHFIYILQEREFVKNNENCYKLGKTINPKQRLSSYPKGSKIFLILKCDDCDRAEKDLIDMFKTSFFSRNDIGKEYFQGDLLEMTNTVMKYLLTTTDEC